MEIGIFVLKYHWKIIEIFRGLSVGTLFKGIDKSVNLGLIIWNLKTTERRLWCFTHIISRYISNSS